MSFFCADRLTAGYGGAPVLQEVSFSLQAGTVTGVLGGNGSGKSTLLKSVCGILPHSGSCTLEGERLETLSPRRLARLCGYVPQSCGIAINISLLDVVLMGFNPCLGLLERPSRAMRQEARRALALVGLEGGGRLSDPQRGSEAAVCPGSGSGRRRVPSAAGRAGERSGCSPPLAADEPPAAVGACGAAGRPGHPP